VVGAPLGVLTVYIVQTLLDKTFASMRSDTFSLLANKHIRAFEDKHSGDLVSRMTNDMAISHGLFINLSGLVSGFVHGVGGLTAVFLLDVRFGIIVLTLGSITILVNALFATVLRQRNTAIQKQRATTVSRLTDLLKNGLLAKYFEAAQISYIVQLQRQQHSIGRKLPFPRKCRWHVTANSNLHRSPELRGNPDCRLGDAVG
jgi:ABC-type multidrug transport system fused ATPase/permease subunit